MPYLVDHFPQINPIIIGLFCGKWPVKISWDEFVVRWLGTEWWRLIGCLISWAPFLKLATNYRALLRKMTCKDKAFCGSSPLYSWITVANVYEVATIRRLLQIIGLFCKRALEKRLYSAKETYNLKKLYSAKETYNLKKPTNRSQPYKSQGDLTQLRWIRGSLKLYVSFAKEP